MKKFILLTTLFFISYIYINGQESQNLQENFNKHEIKVNAAYAFINIVDISYEYIIPKSNSAAGISILFSLPESYDDVKYIMPYFKLFFGNSIGKGFFVEGHILYGKEESYFREEGSTLGAGLSIGAKFKRRKLVVEPIIGLGKAFNDDVTYYDIYPKIGVNMGFSF